MRVNALIEVVDARAPLATHSEAFRTGRFLMKPRVIALTHADLADPHVTREWLRHLGPRAVAVDAVRGSGVSLVLDGLVSLRVRGEVRAMVVGLPNVGKSSLVNRLTGRARAHTGDRPGITVGEQWIEARPGLRLLDEPGLLPFHPGPLAYAVGSVPEGRLAATEVLERLWALERVRRRLVRLLVTAREQGTVGVVEADDGTGSTNAAWNRRDGSEVSCVSGSVPVRQGTVGARDSEAGGTEEGLGDTGTTDEAGDLGVYLERVAFRIGALEHGGQPDTERAARHVLSALRSGALGRLSLERPDGAGVEGGVPGEEP